MNRRTIGLILCALVACLALLAISLEEPYEPDTSVDVNIIRDAHSIEVIIDGKKKRISLEKLSLEHMQ